MHSLPDAKLSDLERLTVAPLLDCPFNRLDHPRPERDANVRSLSLEPMGQRMSRETWSRVTWTIPMRAD
jgi:hypothetical protein